MENQSARRPLKSRQSTWAKGLAQAIANAGISPNMISFVSIVFAMFSLVSALMGMKSPGPLWPILAACFIQLRLICNLMDGMVAMEFNKKSKTGDLWNDVPDRFADVMIILGAGYYSAQIFPSVELAWLNGVLAVLTAYIRVLGASLSSPHYYIGPMAKPQRMALVTVAFVIEAIYPTGWVLHAGLWIMLVGQIVTVARRLSWIARDLKNQ